MLLDALKTVSSRINELEEKHIVQVKSIYPQSCYSAEIMRAKILEFNKEIYGLLTGQSIRRT